MKRRLTVFFLIHFSIIFTLSVCVSLNSYFSLHYNRKPYIPVLGFLKDSVYDNAYFSSYLIFSGINTGYGFYGMNTSTEKVLTLELYDSSKKFMKEDAFFKFSTTSGFSRLKGFASHLANHISDTKSISERDSSDAAKAFIKIRDTYTEKIFKWLGKDIARSTPGCRYYKVKLNTIVPVDIWHTSTKTPDIYVIKEMEFPVQ